MARGWWQGFTAPSARIFEICATREAIERDRLTVNPPPDERAPRMQIDNLFDIRQALRDIEASKGDREAAHGLKDALHQAVLEGIRDGSIPARPVQGGDGLCAATAASLALTSRSIDFERWYA